MGILLQCRRDEEGVLVGSNAMGKGEWCTSPYWSQPRAKFKYFSFFSGSLPPSNGDRQALSWLWLSWLRLFYRGTLKITLRSRNDLKRPRAVAGTASLASEYAYAASYGQYSPYGGPYAPHSAATGLLSKCFTRTDIEWVHSSFSAIDLIVNPNFDPGAVFHFSPGPLSPLTLVYLSIIISVTLLIVIPHSPLLLPVTLSILNPLRITVPIRTKPAPNIILIFGAGIDFSLKTKQEEKNNHKQVIVARLSAPALWGIEDLCGAPQGPALHCITISTHAVRPTVTHAGARRQARVTAARVYIATNCLRGA
ncbi:hypothetical protein EVAR_41536_1 [Eumeta japonica]|uniref:Uncharacterized protein n=1 Tax=Eumeta variegata TaxID=151549 RepID=A0A4C1X2B4_EUMVA|nr:hypothetical protein EVAR_41536_1 [Eumeta japonica]